MAGPYVDDMTNPGDFLLEQSPQLLARAKSPTARLSAETSSPVALLQRPGRTPRPSSVPTPSPSKRHRTMPWWAEDSETECHSSCRSRIRIRPFQTQAAPLSHRRPHMPATALSRSLKYCSASTSVRRLYSSIRPLGRISCSFIALHRAVSLLCIEQVDGIVRETTFHKCKFCGGVDTDQGYIREKSPDTATMLENAIHVDRLDPLEF